MQYIMKQYVTTIQTEDSLSKKSGPKKGGKTGWILWHHRSPLYRTKDGNATTKAFSQSALLIRIWIGWGSQISFLAWKLIWKVKIPYKVAVLIWLVVKEAALTQENLMKRGIQMCPRCYFCEQQAKRIDHLFLQCKVVKQAPAMEPVY